MIDDLVDTSRDGRVGHRRAGAVYVPVGSYVDLVFTTDVALSYADGSINTFLTQGELTDEFIFDQAFLDGIEESEGEPDITIAGINMKDAGGTDYSGTLPGDGSKTFAPTIAIFTCRTATALNGDVQVRIGLSLGGTEILPATALTGLDAVDETYVVQMAGHFDAIPDNSTIHVQVSTADSGTAGTMQCYLGGRTS
jgi:hypothetical protein